MLHVERNGHTHLLCSFVMESAVIPILDKASSVGMKLVQILDCNSIHSISADTQGPQLLNDLVLHQFKDAFTGLGKLPGESKSSPTQYLLLTFPANCRFHYGG